jgi:glycosyltransferase involved in cell wall biosynthesis
MKVTIATGIFPPDIGGPATYVSQLANTLVDQGVRLEVVTYGDELEASGSPFHVTRVGRDLSLLRRYVSFFRAARRAGRGTGIFFAQDPLSSGLPALFAALSLRTPLVVKIVGDLAWEIASDLGKTSDTVDAFQDRRYEATIEWARRAERYVARSAARVIVPSKYLKRLVGGWGIAPERIDVIYNSLPEPGEPLPSRRDARRELGISEGPVLFSAGRLVPWKGFETLVSLMPHLPPATRLLIGGSGPHEKSLRRIISEKGLDDRVTLTGPLGAGSMNRYLAAADLLALASSYEGFSHLLLEASRAGLPVVASAVGGNPELIEDGKSGFLVPLGDTSRWKDRILKLLNDETLRGPFAERGREKALGFLWETTVEETLAVLRSCAKLSD